MERKAARGGWPGGTKPFGLTVGDDNLLATTEDFAVTCQTGPDRRPTPQGQVFAQ